MYNGMALIRRLSRSQVKQICRRHFAMHRRNGVHKNEHAAGFFSARHGLPVIDSQTSEPIISVVVPAYNEVKRLPVTVERISKFLSHVALDYEIIIVDDGSTDHTASVASALTVSYPCVRSLASTRNRGKGAAVRQGTFVARGATILLCDADLATPIEAVSLLQAKLSSGYDIAIGSRAVLGASADVHQPLVRRVMGRIFNLLVRALGVPGIRDTQCGFKLFHREVAKDLFARATVDGFAFDVEILLLADGRYQIAEVAVPWCHVPGSKVSPFRAAACMVWDLLKLRIRKTGVQTRSPQSGKALGGVNGSL